MASQAPKPEPVLVLTPTEYEELRQALGWQPAPVKDSEGAKYAKR